MRIRAPDKTTVSVSSDCDRALLALSVFAPFGLATVERHSNLSLMDVATGRAIEFPARHVKDIASLFCAFALIRETKTEELAGSKPPPLPDAIFDPPARDPSLVPDWIASNPDFKPTLVEDDGRIVLSFAPLRMNAKSKYLVDGRCDEGFPDYWGYEVTADGRPFGWVVLMAPGTVLVTGAGNNKYSKHRNVTSAMFRLSSHLGVMELSE
ncbi:hypothetical protein HFO56_00770 [Rhizobium laguerreae]|uniref:hypothetical protein n=1 Tax=Rhizobium laguerreae TaxID=1076926 RepID=UPI001C91E9AA|nr:hypothetical protein [Rhizobium laguerreae]MBY3150962.1 hypothetical protein [Rhizobium laguerreae]